MTSRIKTVFGTLFITMLGLMFASCVTKPPPQPDWLTSKVQVRGRVLDSENNPIQKAEVNITDVQDLVMFTDQDGVFTSGPNTKLYDPNKEKIVIMIKKIDYTFKGFEGGKDIFWGPGFNDLSNFRLTRVDDYLDPGLDTVDEEPISPSPPSPIARLIPIMIYPPEAVAKISELYVDGELHYSSTDANAQEQFDNNKIVIELGQSNYRTISLHFQDFPPKEIKFDDSDCNYKNSLVIRIDMNGSITKTDCQ